MSESETETTGTLEEIDSRLKALAAAEKYLKKPSTISFAERRDLSGKASRAAATLRELRAEHDGAVEAAAEAAAEAEGDDAGTVTAAASPLQDALDEADRVLDKVHAAQPAGLVRKAAGGAKLPGQNRRGTGGMSAQQRPPDRIGGE